MQKEIKSLSTLPYILVFLLVTKFKNLIKFHEIFLKLIADKTLRTTKILGSSTEVNNPKLLKTIF